MTEISRVSPRRLGRSRWLPRPGQRAAIRPATVARARTTTDELAHQAVGASSGLALAAVRLLIRWGFLAGGTEDEELG